MVKIAIVVRLEAKSGKEAELEQFLHSGLDLVNKEPQTTSWYAYRIGPSVYGIFLSFPDEAGRQAHMEGKVAAALQEKAPELLAQPPLIEDTDVLAAKLPS
ncbi:MAG: antibiotic biosynthesis monooxygenase [Gammaproteobacteria bacterium]|nr:antibiotic biosynthesis monooxygenase [Gammaproteobacteria bacterium]